MTFFFWWRSKGLKRHAKPLPITRRRRRQQLAAIVSIIPPLILKVQVHGLQAEISELIPDMPKAETLKVAPVVSTIPPMRLQLRIYQPTASIAYDKNRQETDEEILLSLIL